MSMGRVGPFRRCLIETHLRISQVIFGLIMVITFTGAIVLSVGYRLMVHWIGEGQN